MKKFILFLLSALMLCGMSIDAAAGKPGKFRLVYWNIQNGMWDGQDDDYQRFTDWVKEQKPDVCVWCEAQPIYNNGTAKHQDALQEWRGDERLMDMWKRLGKRYGHKYIYIGGHRDNYPQVVTSRFPLESVARITGNPDTLVSHGAGWVRLQLADKHVNIVTLHTWPQAYGYNVPTEDRERSKAAFEGDKFRRVEMEYICRHTIGTDPDGAEGYWMMMGDFNSRSRVDNWVYKYPDGDTKLLVHDYIRSETPYIDIINDRDPHSFYSSTWGRSRIDFVYCTPKLSAAVKEAHIHLDSYTRPVRDEKIKNFYHPSDHRPIIVDFEL